MNKFHFLLIFCGNLLTSFDAENWSDQSNSWSHLSENHFITKTKIIQFNNDLNSQIIDVMYQLKKIVFRVKFRSFKSHENLI